LTEARVVIGDWRWKYNYIRPHRSIGYNRLERAREVLGETLLEDGQFGEKKHPLLLIIQQEEDRLSKHLQQMGLTPVARERVTFSLPDKDNPFAEFINPSEDDVFAQLMASQGH